MSAADDIALGEVIRRLDDVRSDLREMRSSFVPTASWEQWRRDAYAPRISELEKDNADLRADLKAFKDQSSRDLQAFKDETERRFRANVTMFIAGGISLFGGLILMVLNLVAK